MLKKIAIVVLALAAALALFVASRPSHFHVERSTRVAAAPEVVFPFINDFHHWANWSPWEKLDPGMKKEFTGAPQGEGAAYAWSGNDEVGVGNMRIAGSQPPERVTIALEFIKPFQASNVTVFSVTPAAGGSQVTWGMDGESNFMFKAVSLFMNMDEMVGKDFELGLGNLKALAEADAVKRSARAAP